MSKLWLILALPAVAGAAYFSANRGATPRQGLWEGELSLAEWDTDGLSGGEEQQVKKKLLADWDLDRTRGKERVCMSDRDIAGLRKLEGSLTPDRFNPEECRPNGRQNVFGNIEVGGKCTKSDGTGSLTFAVTGKTERETIWMDLAMDHQVKEQGREAGVQMTLHYAGRYVGPCQKDSRSLGELLAS